MPVSNQEEFAKMVDACLVAQKAIKLHGTSEMVLIIDALLYMIGKTIVFPEKVEPNNFKEGHGDRAS